MLDKIVNVWYNEKARRIGQGRRAKMARIKFIYNVCLYNV